MPLLRHTGVAIYASCAQTCNTSPDLVSVLIFLFPLPLPSGLAKLKCVVEGRGKRKCTEHNPCTQFFWYFARRCKSVPVAMPLFYRRLGFALLPGFCR